LWAPFSYIFIRQQWFETKLSIKFKDVAVDLTAAESLIVKLILLRLNEQKFVAVRGVLLANKLKSH